jgi:hypothetical protein
VARWTISRAPLARIGRPTATAPPSRFKVTGLSFSSPNAGERLSGEGLVQFDGVEGFNRTGHRAHRLRVAWTGPRPIRLGSQPMTPDPRSAANGRQFRAAPTSGSHTTQKEPPSLIPEEFPAVTMPSARKADFRDDNLFAVVSAARARHGRTPPAPPSHPGIVCATAAVCRCWLWAADSTCRVPANRVESGRHSAIWPMCSFEKASTRPWRSS